MRLMRFFKRFAILLRYLFGAVVGAVSQAKGATVCDDNGSLNKQ